MIFKCKKTITLKIGEIFTKGENYEISIKVEDFGEEEVELGFVCVLDRENNDWFRINRNEKEIYTKFDEFFRLDV